MVGFVGDNLLLCEGTGGKDELCAIQEGVE